MAVVGRKAAYELKLHISLKYITANVMDKSNGTIVAQVSTIEHALKRAFDLGRTTKNPHSASVVGQVLSRRLKLVALSPHHRGLVVDGIHADVPKHLLKKGVEDVDANGKIVWGVIESLKHDGIKIIVSNDV